MKIGIGLAFVAVMFFSAKVWADAGVFAGTGQNLKLISTESVQLVNIDVKITLGRGRLPFDGGTAGMDSVDYDCRFVLRNLTNKACAIQVGFPIDSQFARLPKGAKDADWASDYRFTARDEKNTYRVNFQTVDPEKANNAYSAIFTWMMNFKGKETKTLIVQYRIPMSGGAADTCKRGSKPDVQMMMQHPWTTMLLVSLMEFAGYTTETGSSWSANVEKATFTVYTKPFEDCLDNRGFAEAKHADMPKDQKETMKSSLPVQHCWWFRDIQPSGWQPVDGGIKWEYKDYKPKDEIRIAYYLMQIPRLDSEVNAWVDAILQLVPDPHQQASELALARQILLATYGQEPTDAAAKALVADQIWYAPNKDFAVSKLTKDQQAVLAAMDRRLESINKGK